MKWFFTIAFYLLMHPVLAQIGIITNNAVPVGFAEMVQVKAPGMSSMPQCGVTSCAISLPEIVVKDFSVSETDQTASLLVQLFPLSVQTVTVKYEVRRGTASQGNDYEKVSGILTFAPGESEKNINVTIIADGQPEESENFYIDLSQPVNATIPKASAEVTITETNLMARPVPHSETDQIAVSLFTVNALPNPSSNDFSVRVSSSKSKEKVEIKVYDASGRLLDAYLNIYAGTVIKLGKTFKAGIYFLQVIQGKEHSQLKLVKLN